MRCKLTPTKKPHKKHVFRKLTPDMDDTEDHIEGRYAILNMVLCGVWVAECLVVYCQLQSGPVIHLLIFSAL